MLSIVHAAEAQFHHEVEMRQRELALLASIRERRAAQTELVAPRVVAAARLTPREEARRTAVRAAWPRPIGIHDSPATVCAVA
ncbi:hypothetical protein [Microbacterium terregens]|jgi:hypothetical protein|uniref:Uncharacterized protein n=1 Tax=Microbacterium terregens TaxID=69363 RepID=A0ABV5T2D3_9MICO